MVTGPMDLLPFSIWLSWRKQNGGWMTSESIHWPPFKVISLWALGVVGKIAKDQQKKIRILNSFFCCSLCRGCGVMEFYFVSQWHLMAFHWEDTCYGKGSSISTLDGAVSISLDVILAFIAAPEPEVLLPSQPPIGNEVSSSEWKRIHLFSHLLCSSVSLALDFLKKLFLHCPSDLDFSCFRQKISSLLPWLSGSSETALLILICHIPFCPFLYLRTVSWACFNLVIPHRGPWFPQDIFMLSFLEVVFVCFQNSNICRFSLKALWSFQLSIFWYFTRKFIK